MELYFWILTFFGPGFGAGIAFGSMWPETKETGLPLIVGGIAGVLAVIGIRKLKNWNERRYYERHGYSEEPPIIDDGKSHWRMYLLQAAIYAVIMGSNAIWHYEPSWGALSWIAILAAWMMTQAIALPGRVRARWDNHRRAKAAPSADGLGGATRPPVGADCTSPSPAR